VYKLALEAIRLAALETIAFKWIRVESGQVAKLYARNRLSRQRNRFDLLVDELFSFGYSLAALVQPRGGGAMDASTILRDLKGPADPWQAEPYHLRRRLGATNSILNCLHTSDTTADACTEALIFFPRDEVSCAVESVDCPPEPADLVTGEALGGPECRRRLKRRLVNSLLPHLESRLYQLLELEQRVTYGDTIPASVRHSLFLLGKEQTQLISQLFVPRHPAVLLFEWLCEDPKSEWDSEQLVRALCELTVSPSDWEHLVLRCEGLARETP
jgi:nucleoside diphosphate kinase